MILKSLSKYQPANFILYLCIGIVLWLRPIFDSKMPGIFTDSNPMPINTWIFQLFGQDNMCMACKIIALILILLQGLLFNGVINQYNLINIRSYLPGIIYLLIVANLPENQVLHPVFFATLILILSWNQLIHVDYGKNSMSAYFNSALLLAIATLFYPNYTYLLVILISSTFLNRAANFREFGMILTGFLSVWYFYFSLYFIFTGHFNVSGIASDFNISFSDFKALKSGQIIFFIYFLILIIVSIVQSSTSFSNKKIQNRRNLKILFLWFIFGFLMLVFTKSKLELIYLIAIPISAVISIFFTIYSKRWIKELAFMLFIIITIINQFFPNLIP